MAGQHNHTFFTLPAIATAEPGLPGYDLRQTCSVNITNFSRFTDAINETQERPDIEDQRRRRGLFAWGLVGLGVLTSFNRIDFFAWNSGGLLVAVLIGAGVQLMTHRTRRA